MSLFDLMRFNMLQIYICNTHISSLAAKLSSQTISMAALYERGLQDEL